MGLKILVCVSADQATVGLWKGRRLAGCRPFNNDEAGWNAFNSYLTAARGDTAYVMVDTVDEDYRFETLPHAKGKDRNEMVARKLKQLYRGTSYYSYSLQSREADKRKDDRYLFAAFTSPELLSPWLKAVNSQNLPVAGVYSLPMVSVSLLAHLKLKHPNLLVVTKGNAGVRQTFFKDLKFRISRLTPLRETVESADQYYADEVSNTRMYLDALTITHVDDTLQVVILDQDDSLAGLPSAISRGRPNMQCSLIGKAEIVSRFAIAPAELEASTDALHLHLLGESMPSHNFAPPQVTQGFQRYLGRRMIYGAAAAVLAIGLAWSGFNVYDTMRTGDETAEMRRQTQHHQIQYQQVTAQFPETPTTTDNLRHTVEIAQQLRQSVRTPEAMLAVMSHALDASPEIKLLRVEWKYGAQGESGAASSRQDHSGPGGPLLQTGTLRGEVNPFNGDYKGALMQINAFATLLASDPKVAAVHALKLPFNASSESGITGTTNTPGGAGGAEFEFVVTFKPGA
jgi:hypothetical protein